MHLLPYYFRHRIVNNKNAEMSGIGIEAARRKARHLPINTVAAHAEMKRGFGASMRKRSS